MKKSGYNVEEVEDIITSGIRNFERKRNLADKKGWNLHRKGISTLKARNLRKILSKTTWFRKREESDDDDSTGGAKKNGLPGAMGPNPKAQVRSRNHKQKQTKTQ